MQENESEHPLQGLWGTGTGGWAPVTARVAGSSQATSGTWDLAATTMARVQGFSAEAISDQMSGTQNILAAVWGVYWRVSSGNGETEAQRNQVTFPRTQSLPDINPRAASPKGATLRGRKMISRGGDRVHRTALGAQGTLPEGKDLLPQGQCSRSPSLPPTRPGFAERNP